MTTCRLLGRRKRGNTSQVGQNLKCTEGEPPQREKEREMKIRRRQTKEGEGLSRSPTDRLARRSQFRGERGRVSERAKHNMSSRGTAISRLNQAGRQAGRGTEVGPRAKADLDRGELSIVVRVRNRSPRQLVNLAPCILRAAGQIWRTGLSS